MQVAPVQKTNVSDDIAGQLRRQILTGELKAGEKLPPERELALRFGTNRNTLREALRILESSGLLRIRQGASIEIADIAAEGRLELLPYLALYARPTPELVRPLRHAMRLRQVLLSETAAAVAECATEGDIRELKVRCEAIGTMQSPLAEQTADYEFYAALIRMSRSLTFQWSYNSFGPAYLELVRRGGTLWKLPDWTAGSREKVVEAIAAHKPELARTRLYRHFEKLDGAMFQVLDALGKPSRR